MKVNSVASFVAKNLSGYSPMFFYGKANAGKTRLLMELQKSCKENITYVAAEEFLQEFVTAVRNGREAKELFEEKYRNNQLLVIDNIQSFAGKKFTQEELLRVIKDLQLKELPIILLADRHPYQIKNLDEDLRDSFQGGLMLEVI